MAGAQKMILEELNKEFGGSAKAAGETLPGKLNKLRNSFDETAGKLAETLIPAFEIAVGVGGRGSRSGRRRTPSTMKMVVMALGGAGGALIAASVAQTALNLAVLANPYVAAAAAIVVFVGGLIVLWKKSEFVRDHWQLLLGALGRDGRGGYHCGEGDRPAFRHRAERVREGEVGGGRRCSGGASCRSVVCLLRFWPVDIARASRLRSSRLDRPCNPIGGRIRPDLFSGGGPVARGRSGAAGAIVRRPAVSLIGERGAKRSSLLSRMPRRPAGYRTVGGPPAATCGDPELRAIARPERDVLNWLDRAMDRRPGEGRLECTITPALS